MPVIIEWTYADGSKEMETLPAEVWRLNEYEVKKAFLKDKEVVNVAIDPNLELADVDMSNNDFPKEADASRVDKFKGK